MATYYVQKGDLKMSRPQKELLEKLAGGAHMTVSYFGSKERYKVIDNLVAVGVHQCGERMLKNGWVEVVSQSGKILTYLISDLGLDALRRAREIRGVSA